MKLTVNITKDDYKAFRRFARYHIQQIHWLYIGLIVLLEIMTWRGHAPDAALLNKICAAIIIPIFFLGFAGIVFALHLGLRKIRGGTLHQQCGPHEYEITSGMLIEINDSGRTETKLDQIKKVYDTSKHIFIMRQNGMTHIIPKRELGADCPADAVIAKLRENAEQSVPAYVAQSAPSAEP